MQFFSLFVLALFAEYKTQIVEDCQRFRVLSPQPLSKAVQYLPINFLGCFVPALSLKHRLQLAESVQRLEVVSP